MANRIHSKGPYRQEEAVAGEAGIYPGMLIKLNSAGAVIKHSTNQGVLGDEFLIAAEDALQGNTVSTVYANGSIVTYLIPAKGSCVNALIKDGEDIAIGDHLMSGSGGLLVEQSTPVVSNAVATEANDLTGSNTSNTLSEVRVV